MQCKKDLFSGYFWILWDFLFCTKVRHSTGCPGSNFATSKSFYSETVYVRSQDGKAKMCLRDIHFCILRQLFVYNRHKSIIIEPYFQSCFHGKTLDCYAWGPWFKSCSGYIKLYIFTPTLHFLKIFQKLKSQTHFGFTNLGSDMHRFWEKAIWNCKFDLGHPVVWSMND